MRILYTIAVRLYAFGVRIAALFGNAKAKLWVEGRRLFAPKSIVAPTEQWIWFHAASLGEFEQGRPLIEALKRDHPQYKILLSFFSPSGYEIRKDYPLADEVLYLPIDTPQNAKAWLQRHHFVAAFFIKYEFWFNYMAELQRRNIPLFYISLILNGKSFFFKPYGQWFRKQLSAVSHFFVQDETTEKLLQGIGYENVTVCGDTRFDRVVSIAEQAKPFPEIERFIGGRKCIIAGSTWPPDEQLLSAIQPDLPADYCLILAPHDVSERHIAQIVEHFPDSVLYSELQGENQNKVLIINTIGMLSQLYQYARFAYVGGAFGAGLHNIQEPVAFGCPVVFGPRHENFKEAVDLVALRGVFTVKDAAELRNIVSQLVADDAIYCSASGVCKNYLEAQRGATQCIVQQSVPLFSQQKMTGF